MADHKDDPDFYLAHKDDDVWEPGEPIQRRAAKLSTVVSVRFAHEEIERLRDEAPDGNLSRLIRARALGGARPSAQVEQPTTAAEIDSRLRVVTARRLTTRSRLDTTLPAPAHVYPSLRSPTLTDEVFGWTPNTEFAAKRRLH